VRSGAGDDGVYLRSMAARARLGGLADATSASVEILSAVFDFVFVETVGVGQSETAVAEMVDMFLLLLQPGGGDELQGIKRGIVELADLVVVNKADGDFAAAARRTAAEYQNALHLLRPASPNWSVAVQGCSALEGTGVAEVWESVERYRAALGPSGEISARRAEQARAWMWNEVGDGLLAAVRRHPKVRSRLTRLEQAVMAGEMPPAAAARDLLSSFLEDGI
jgi:LAO/AO transport system kinase